LCVGHTVSPAKTAEPVEMPFWREQLAWVQWAMYYMWYIWAPPSEYDLSIRAQPAMQAIGTVSIATSFVFSESD